jgi:hypothetical protein
MNGIVHQEALWQKDDKVVDRAQDLGWDDG